MPDEVLRFPLDQALVIIRGQKILRVRKMDYTMHPDAKKLIQEKTDSHVPVWRREEELRAEQDSKVRQEDIGEQESGFEQGIWSGKELKKEDESQEVGKSKANEKIFRRNRQSGNWE